jgi:type II secretory pathway predicted ATPase ExeA
LGVLSVGDLDHSLFRKDCATMYEQFFGLNRRPFAAAPDADCYFPATAIEAARQTLFRCIDRGEGAALLIGPSGAGKSLLLQVLAEQFISRFELALLASGRLGTLRELLQAILYELGLEYRELQEGELRLALIDHLSDTRLDGVASGERGPEGLLLLIDEAHTLPLKLLEEIRLITNLIRDGQPKVRLVLAGSPALEERFTSPKLDAFSQRVSARCYLQPLDRGETFEYIKAQIEWAAGQPDSLFSRDALDAVYQATGGIPRLINQICDHALVLACGEGLTSLGKKSIESAWADLQQLPAPASDATDASQSSAGVIEFGVLDDASSNEYDLEIDPGLDSSCELSFDEPAIDLRPAFGSQDPLRSLSQVEQQIAAIDSDYVSQADAEPQIDLSFEATFDPFSETFAEEELVIDPFAMTATDALANRPIVQCAEGHNLAALLKPLPERPAPKLTIAAPAETLEFDADEIDFDSPGSAAADELSIETNEPLVFEMSQDNETQPVPAVAFWSSEETARQPDDARGSRYATYRLVADSSKSQGRTDTAHDDGYEPDLIVIEDEPPGVHQVNVVRRGQYRRLFSSMRHG